MKRTLLLGILTQLVSISLISQGEWVKVDFNNQIPDTSVLSILYDQYQDQLWITYKHGVAVLSDTGLEVIRPSESGVTDSTLYLLQASPQGEIWFACEEGVMLFDGLDWIKFHSDSGYFGGSGSNNKVVYNSAMTSDGVMWVAIASSSGTFSKGGSWSASGIWKYDDGIWDQVLYNPEYPYDIKMVYNWLVENDDLIIFTNESGIYKVNRDKTIILRPESPNVYTRSGAIAEDGSYWYAADGALWNLKPSGSFNAYTNILVNKYIDGCMIDKRNHLFFFARDGYIVEGDLNSPEYNWKLLNDLGLPELDRAGSYGFVYNNQMISVNGVLTWFVKGNNGIFKYDGEDIEIYNTDNQLISNDIYNFFAVSGPFYAITNGQNGRLWIATPKGVLEYIPKEVFSPEPLFPIDDSEVGTDEIEFEWKNSSETFLNQIQISSDLNFENILVDSIIESPQCLLAIPNNFHGGSYYWRVKGNNSSYESDWSLIFKFNISGTFIEEIGPLNKVVIKQDPDKKQLHFQLYNQQLGCSELKLYDITGRMLHTEIIRDRNLNAEFSWDYQNKVIGSRIVIYLFQCDCDYYSGKIILY